MMLFALHHLPLHFLLPIQHKVMHINIWRNDVTRHQVIYVHLIEFDFVLILIYFSLQKIDK